MMSMQKMSPYHPYYLHCPGKRVVVKETERRCVVKSYLTAPRPMQPLEGTYDLFTSPLVRTQSTFLQVISYNSSNYP